MATVASTQSGWDGTNARPIRGLVALKISATNALVLAQTGNGDGFGQLLPAENELEFAVPALKDTDDVLGAQLAAADANIAIAYAKRSASGASPKVKIGFFNVGADDANITADPVVIDVWVARR